MPAENSWQLESGNFREDKPEIMRDIGMDGIGTDTVAACAVLPCFQNCAAYRFPAGFGSRTNPC
jgi:hypothetical protein